MATAPRRSRWLTTTLVAANLAVFLATLLLSGAWQPDIDVLASGWKDNLSIRAGQYWRLVTCCFLHANWLHLAMNMAVLWHVGSLLEPLIGAARLAIIYAASGLAGAMLSYATAPFVTVGASGAVVGVATAGLVLARLRPLPAAVRQEFGWRMLAWLAATLLLGELVPRVDGVSHVGGMAAGLVLGAVLGAGPARGPWRRGLLRGLAAAAALVTMVAFGLLARGMAGHDLVRRELPELGLSIELPEAWLPGWAGHAVRFEAVGIPARLLLRRVARPVAQGGEAGWLTGLAAGWEVLAGPTLLTADSGRLYWQRLRRGVVAEQYVWLWPDGQAAELIGVVDPDELGRYRAVFGRAAASLRRLR